MQHTRSWLMLAPGACSALTAACGSVEPKPPALPPATEAAKPCGPEALIDDGEDHDNQALVRQGRGGYWYTFVDDAGSTVEPLAGAHGGTFAMSEGGARGSSYAARFSGQVARGGTVYVGMGCNFTEPKDAYDASRYAGISFFAKRGAGLGTVRLKVPDVSTDPQGGLCSECYNDFGTELELSERWTHYVVPFSAMRQQPGWGSPRRSQLTPAQLYSVQFQVNSPGRKFDIWVDDLAFTGCR